MSDTAIEQEEVDETTTEPEDETTTEPEDETTTEPEPEPEPEPEQQPAMSEREIEQAMKRLEKHATHNANRISEILGDEAQSLVPCPLCPPITPGFRYPVPLDDEQRQAVLDALGMTDQGELAADDEAERCDRCNGFGETVTGSRVPGSETRPCTKCAAKGWTTKSERETYDSTHAVRAIVAPVNGTDPPVASETYELPAFDAWTRPAGHPNYGKNPAYMTPAERDADWEGAR